MIINILNNLLKLIHSILIKRMLNHFYKLKKKTRKTKIKIFGILISDPIIIETRPLFFIFLKKNDNLLIIQS